MRSRTSLVVSLLTAGSAAAQPAPEPADPLGPVRCYTAATRGANLTLVQAKQLCIGAASEAPARCFTQATAQGFADTQAVQLCAGAISPAPAECARQLDRTTGFDNATVVSYCAALRWPLIPITGQSEPACVTTARGRTMLPDHYAVQLCSGSTSTGPADCYAWGQTSTQLTDKDLVDLCRPVEPYPYVP